MISSTITKSTLKAHIAEYLKSLWDNKILYFLFRGSNMKLAEGEDALPDNTLDSNTPITKAILLSGSFNPVHQGHVQLLEASVKKLKDYRTRGYFSLPVVNCDKGAIQLQVALQRILQFRDRGLDVILYTQPIFSKKSQFFKNCTFTMGFDTFIRVYDLKYYNNDELELIKALDQILKNDCDFLVAGRQNPQTGEFQQFNQVAISKIPYLNQKRFLQMIKHLKKEEFSNDMSSTKLRKQNKGVPQIKQ